MQGIQWYLNNRRKHLWENKYKYHDRLHPIFSTLSNTRVTSIRFEVVQIDKSGHGKSCIAAVKINFCRGCKYLSFFSSTLTKFWCCTSNTNHIFLYLYHCTRYIWWPHFPVTLYKYITCKGHSGACVNSKLTKNGWLSKEFLSKLHLLWTQTTCNCLSHSDHTSNSNLIINSYRSMMQIVSQYRSADLLRHMLSYFKHFLFKLFPWLTWTQVCFVLYIARQVMSTY